MLKVSTSRLPATSGLVALGLWVLIAFFGSTAALAQIPYAFEPVADTRSPGDYSGFGLPVINSRGDVAFAAGLQSGGSGIYKYSAATNSIVTIFEDPTNDWFDLHHRFAAPAIDNAGNVIFQYEHGVIRIGSGGASTVLVDESSTIPLGADPGPFACQEANLVSRSVDATGHVVVTCLVQNQIPSGGGIYLASPGSLSRVCDSSSFGSIFPACFYSPIVLASNGLLGGVGWNSATGSEQTLLRGRAAALEVLLDPAIDGHQPGLGGPSYLSQMAINASGRILYSTYQASSSSPGYAIYGIDNAGTPFNVTDPQGVYRSAGRPSINDLGELAFVDEYLLGLFNGPDPVVNKVMGRGDDLPGYAIPGFANTVQAVSFEHPGINDAGELVFIAHLADGTLVIVRAVPPNNHPPDVSMGDQSSPEGSPVSVQVNASDQDGDALSYSLAAGSAPAPGTIQAVPPGLSIDSSGLISGTPAAGTAGDRYAVALTVTDARHAATTVEFVWTITQAPPLPRANLTATANFGAQGIDLTWQNPSPDTATHLTISFSQNGPGGPFVEWQTFAPDETGYLFLLPTGSGLDLCFTANGVLDLPADSIVSANSNIACATYPRFEILPAQSVQTGADRAAFSFSTNMPASVTLTGLPAGALYLITSAPPNDPAPTSFVAQIWNLPSPSTLYSVELVGESLPVGLDAERSVSFTTSAGSGGGGPGGGQVTVELSGQNLQTRTGQIVRYEPSRNPRTPNARVAIVQFQVDVRVTNSSPTVSVNDTTITSATTLRLFCPPTSNECLDTFNEYAAVAGLPSDLGTLAPGQQSGLVTLTFEVHEYALRGLSGLFGNAGILGLDVTFDVPSGSSGHQVLDLPVTPHASDADLRLASFTATIGGDIVRYHVVVENLGPARATGPQVFVSLAPGVRFVRGGDSRYGVVCGVPSRTDYVLCDTRGTAEPGTSFSFDLDLDVRIVGAGTIATTATAAAGGDRILTNNSITLLTGVGIPSHTRADVAISLTDEQDPVPSINPRNPTVRYHIVVTNNGPEAAANVRVQLAPGSLDDFGFTGSDCDIGGLRDVCTLGDMAIGESIDLVLYGDLGLGNHVTSVSVTSAAIDETVANNAASELTTVIPSWGSSNF